MSTLILTITCLTPLRIGTESDVRRDAAGRPCIPATTLKGRLRVEVERIAVALGGSICKPPNAVTMCHPHAASPPCVVCDLFGSPWTEGRLYFEDLLTNATPILIARQRTTHSRARG